MKGIWPFITNAVPGVSYRMRSDKAICGRERTTELQIIIVDPIEQITGPGAKTFAHLLSFGSTIYGTP